MQVIINGRDWGELDTLLAKTTFTGVNDENVECFEIGQRYILLKDGTLLATASDVATVTDSDAGTVTYDGPVHVETHWQYRPGKWPEV